MPAEASFKLLPLRHVTPTNKLSHVDCTKTRDAVSDDILTRLSRLFLAHLMLRDLVPGYPDGAS